MHTLYSAECDMRDDVWINNWKGSGNSSHGLLLIDA